MTQNKQQVNKIFQVFEADDGLIYRLYVRNEPQVKIADIDVRGANGASVLKRAVFLDSEDNAPVRLLSLLVDHECHTPTVTLRGKRLTTLSKLDYHKLAFARDFRMVNPAIDGRYREWVDAHPTTRGLAQTDLCLQPLISVIVPLFNTPIPYLRDMLDSVLSQTYDNWELVLINASPQNEDMAQTLSSYSDPKIKLIKIEKNLGIAGNTNIGIKAAAGDYIAFFDHDDVLDQNALLEYAATINDDPSVDLLYCDEDNFEENVTKSHSPLFKPDFNLDLLYSHNYVVHMLAVSRRVIEKVELSPDYVSGAQDYDMTLKAFEVARSIRHIPKVLYHWRIHAGSTNGGVMDSKPYAIEAGRRTLEDHFARRGISCTVTPSSYINCVYDIGYIPRENDDITVVIPYSSEKNLNEVIASLRSCHSSKNVKVIAVGPEACCADNSIETISWNSVFDFTGMLRKALDQVSSARIVVCSELIRFNDEKCIEQLCAILDRPEVGIAGAKLFSFDGLVQHAGMCLNENGAPIAINQNFTAKMGGGYLGLAECCCDYSAVTPDCFAMHTDDLKAALADANKAQGNAPSFMYAVCNSLRQAGKLIVVSPQSVATVVLPSQQESARLPAPRINRVKDVLANPAVSYASGYPQLNIARDEKKETDAFIRDIFLRKLHLKR